ncbi:MAG TPA: M23 family metallopeptidase [Vicinamibacterales bacterium]|jgi:hypothetical protein|nr:M23 family metallopeptidase [Vicinamibacterales bacterium]
MSGVILGFTVLMALSAQQPPPRAPVVQSVDLLVPFAPVMFKQAGSMQLAYELHITNFLSVDVSLNTVQVKASNGQTLAEYKDAELQRRMVRPGLRNDHATPHVLGAGARGQVIAKLGSSGSTSIGPHLHFHVADASSLLAAEGLPFVFLEFAQLGEYASIDALLNGEQPSLTAGDRRAELERPAPNSVVRFPSSPRQ